MNASSVENCAFCPNRPTSPSTRLTRPACPSLACCAASASSVSSGSPRPARGRTGPPAGAPSGPSPRSGSSRRRACSRAASWTPSAAPGPARRTRHVVVAVAGLAPDPRDQVVAGLVGAAGGGQHVTLGAGPAVEQRPQAVLRAVHLRKIAAPASKRLSSSGVRPGTGPPRSPAAWAGFAARATSPTISSSAPPRIASGPTRGRARSALQRTLHPRA